MSTPISSQPTDDLKQKLTEEQYRVTQECGTEPAFANLYWNNHEDGMYRCIVCNTLLFTSKEKYDSGSGWPSFWAAVDKSNLDFIEDVTFGMKRVEVRCKTCGAHLGHIFPDGPEPSGMRYCINSAALNFNKMPHDQIPNSENERT
jgi:peptide-methionine (R)-S-oxide reductase